MELEWLDARQEAQTATRKLFQGFWLNKATPSTEIGDSLIQLAESLNHKLSEKALAGYLASLSALTRDQIVLAFSRAPDEAKFFPVPTLLRDFASVAPRRDPIANEAREQLFRIVAANLACMAGTVEVSVHAESEAGFENSKLQNGVLEPLRESLQMMLGLQANQTVRIRLQLG
jgi:hypothetical protein